MKVILATPLYPPEVGGPATYTKELAERLRDDHEVTIVAYATTSEKIDRTTLRTVSKRRPLPIRLLKFATVLFKAAKGKDVIYVQNAMAAGLPAIIVGVLRRIPVVLKFVGDEAWERATQLKYTTKELEEFLQKPDGSLRIKLMMLVQGFVLRRATIVTTPSAYLGEVVIKTYGVNREKLKVNYNAADKTEILPFEEPRRPHSIVATARLVPWKGIDGIIKATAILAKEFPDVHLFIAGDGPEEESLRGLVQQLGADKRVTFLGRVSRAETWHVRKTGEVYVLNSTYEGLPHTVLTSFAAEIPIVATNISGTNETIEHEKSGLLIPPHAPEALAAAITRIFKDEALKRRLVEGGKHMLENKFSWGAHLKTLLAILESVRAKPRN